MINLSVFNQSRQIMPKTLPKELTSYDFLKTFAVVFMIIDHIGWYFFPEDNWWRVVGRLCVPVWFFLIGYANSRDLSPRLWMGAFILFCGDLIAGQYFFPLNILATMIIVRLFIDQIMERSLHTTNTFWAINTLLFLLILPSGMLFEYGTQGFILAILGYLMRRRHELPEQKDLINTYFAFAMGSFVAMQFILFNLTEPQLITLIAGLLLVMGSLYVFKAANYPKLTKKLPRPLIWVFQFGGRRTLEIYVAHLLLFKALGMYGDPERFTFLEWGWFFTGL